MATARDVIKQLIEVYPVKEQKGLASPEWIEKLQKSRDILFEFDLDSISRLQDILKQMLPEDEFMFELSSRFGTRNVLISDKDNSGYSEVSYYLTTGVLFGMVQRLDRKYSLEQKITLDKTGYHFSVEPLRVSNHPANGVARPTIQKFLYELYGCQ